MFIPSFSAALHSLRAAEKLSGFGSEAGACLRRHILPHRPDFAQHHGFVPRLCQPYRPRTKGKVERFIRYLRGSFYVPLASQLRADGLKADRDTANGRVRNAECQSRTKSDLTSGACAHYTSPNGEL